MTNKNELEEITISSLKDAKAYEKEFLKDKHITVVGVAWDTKFKHLENCIVEGGKIVCESMYKTKFIGADKVHAEKVAFSIFENCNKILIDYSDKGHGVETSRFIDCRTIIIVDTGVEDCMFSNFEILHLTDAIVKNCLVENIICKNDCVISMEDGEMSNVSFDNIELCNGAYLIEGYGEPWVEDSVFLNIRTSREDRELFHQEETNGLSIKKKKEYCFVDENSCSGLNLVMDLDGNIDFQSFLKGE